jgi:hypothetical protein
VKEKPMLGDKVEFLKTDVSLETDVKRMIDYAVDRISGN